MEMASFRAGERWSDHPAPTAAWTCAVHDTERRAFAGLSAREGSPKAAVALALERATSFVGTGFGMAAHAGDCDGMQGPVQRTSGQRSRHRLNRGEQAVRSELRGLSVRVDVLSYCVELR